MMEREENNIKHGIWSDDIAEFERFFKVAKLPSEPIRLDSCSQITNIPLFIESHLSIVKAQNGNKRFTPYLDRLKFITEYLKTKLN